MDQADFKSQIDNLKKLLRTINKDITKRQQLQKQGKGTGIIDMEIKGYFTRIEQDLKNVDDSLSKAEKNIEMYGVSERELSSYRNQYNTILSDKNTAYTNYGADSGSSSHVINFETKNKFTDQYDTEQMNNQQLLEATKNEQKKQDEKLDALINVTGQINHVAKATNKELTEQEEIYDELGYGMDKNTAAMEKNSGKMQKLLKSSSNTCLTIGIIVEMAICITLFVV